MSRALDIAREMARLIEAGMPTDEMIATTQKAFPSATPAELQHACLVGRDQARMWRETTLEDAAAVFDLMAKGASEAEVRAALERAKLRAETIFPTKPDKTRS